jgi:hypothetical protein
MAHRAHKAHTSPGLMAHRAHKAHTSPGLMAHRAHKAHTSPRLMAHHDPQPIGSECESGSRVDFSELKEFARLYEIPLSFFE